MPSDIANILQEFLEQLKTEMLGKLKSASGQTAQLFEVNITEEKEGVFSKVIGSLITPNYIGALESGRGKTVNTAAGSPTLQQKVLTWLQSQSITPIAKQGKTKTLKAMTQVQLSWAIATSIHKNGTLLYQQGGKSGIISQVLYAGRIEAFVEVFGTKASKILLNEIKTLITK